ncbi:hypothetical protein FQA39_LY09243 [Lamprigera yunnana]|nr:hypothetical protein FQA39_LY09243 [Lamprigera yunnana]
MDSKTVVLDPKSTIGDSASKILTWDPWNKLARKNKNEKKRKEKQSHSSKLRCTSSFLKNHPSGDELHTNSIEAQVVIPKSQEIYEYQPYKTAKKSVDFVNEVSVMHFAGDVIIDQTMEPLKKELDQQIRNKEMRRGHIPCTLLNKKVVSEDYMSGWFKK